MTHESTHLSKTLKQLIGEIERDKVKHQQKSVMDDMSKSRALKLAKDFIGGQWLRLQTEDIHVAPLR